MRLSIEAAAAESPQRIALVADGSALTFAELWARTRRGMRWLRARGLAPDATSPVAVVGVTRLETVVALHALMALRVPIVLVHPRLTPVERAALIADCEPSLVLDEAALGALAAESQAATPMESDGGAAVGDAERICAVLYTSGTTGTSKGALLSERALIASALASEQNLGWRDDDRWLLAMPLAHVGGLSILTRCLLGRRAVVLPSWRGSFSAEALCDQLKADRVTLLSLVPTQLARLLELSDWRPPPSLRAVLLGGAPAPGPLLARAAERGVPVLCTYGLTEACSQVTVQSLGTAAATGSVGRPLPGVELRIVGDEIHVRGAVLLSGYHRRGGPPQQPFLDGGWFATGDLGRLDEAGELHVLSRRTDLILTGGENVYPREVEQAIERVDGVAATCVFGVGDPVWGQLVAALVVPEPGAEPGELIASLRARLLDELAPHRRPRRVALVAALPLTAAGKVDRAAAFALVQRGELRLDPL